MPRPGPRPYECVRRAWHSDRHKPMRGSIIQQIFRVVYETHSPVTKKNKEWQEKLPLVVLRAEEIMYSKASSEAEYMNLETLWDRVNDAMNTIIRRDETTETEGLLPPCIEAALNLGCVPVRASRSQRHNNPRSYLTPPIKTLDKITDEPFPPLSRLPSINSLRFEGPTTENNALSVSHKRNTQVNLSVDLPLPRNYCSLSSLENVPVYPLYYGTHYEEPEKNSSVFLGRPVITSSPSEPAEKNFFPEKNSAKNDDCSNNLTFRNFMDKEESGQVAECDLSLRLGLASQKSSVFETENVGSSSSQEGSKTSSDQSLQMNKEFSFFRAQRGHDHPTAFCSKMCDFEGRCLDFEGARNKRKAVFGNNEDAPFGWRMEGPSNQYDGGTKRPELGTVHELSHHARQNMSEDRTISKSDSRKTPWLGNRPLQIKR